MARSRYYSKRIYKYPKQKWSPVIKSGEVVLNINNYATILNLVENSTDSSTPTPVVIKAKHFKLQADTTGVQVTGGGYTTPSGLYAGIIYVPEGITITTRDNITALISSHPEWVIIHTLLECGPSQDQLVQKYSSLSRNLNSGDRIVFYAFGLTFPEGGNSLKVNYNISWVNRAN